MTACRIIRGAGIYAIWLFYRAQTENQSLRDIISGMEKEHSKNMNKIQMQYEAKVEKVS